MKIRTYDFGCYLKAFCRSAVLKWRGIPFVPRYSPLARCPRASVPLRCSRPLAMGVHVFLCVPIRPLESQNSLVWGSFLAGLVGARLRGENDRRIAALLVVGEGPLRGAFPAFCRRHREMGQFTYVNHFIIVENSLFRVITARITRKLEPSPES
jgi:hypothetical protein